MTKRSTRRALKLIVPTVLGVSVAALAHCGSGGNPTDANVADAVSDGAPADARACNDVREEDGGLRYRVCTSDVNPSCARVEYPDGAVQDPTFC